MPTIRPNPLESCVGSSGADLVLKVCDAPFDGRLVRIAAAKCTIGSGERCTLRLRARGVAPVHCLIVRGNRGAAVRRWSRETRLNGGAFLDAPLRVGDRLGIGPLELEVVSLPLPEESPESAPVAEARAPTQELWERIAQQDRQLAEQSEALAEERRRREQLETAAQQHASQEQTWRHVIDEQERRVALLEQAAAGSISADEFELRRQAWQSERASLEAELEIARRAHEATQLLAADNRASVEERAAWEAEKLGWERRMQHAEDAARQAHERAEHWKQTAIDRLPPEALDEQKRAWERRLEEQRQNAEQLHAELLAARSELERRLAHAQLDLDEMQARLAQQATQLAAHGKLEEWEAQLAAWETRQADWEQTAARLQSDLDHTRRQGDEERQRLQEVIEQLRQAAHRRETELAEREAMLAEREKTLLDWTAELDRREAALRDPPAHSFAAEIQEAATSPVAAEQAKGTAAENQHGPAFDRSPADAEPMISSTLVLPRRETIEESPSSTLVLPHREVIDLAGAEAETIPPREEAEATPPSPSVSSAENEASSPFAGTAFMPQSDAAFSIRSASPSANDDEESIEDYMNRLLKRVRGEDVGAANRRPSPATGAGAVGLRPAAAPLPLPVPPSAGGGLVAILGGPTVKSREAPAPITAEEFIPRSQAPERSDRLAAMRDLANSSARSAIDRYAKTMWLSRAATKLSMSGGTVVAAGALLVFASASPIVAYVGAALATTCAAVWLAQGVRYAKHYARARHEQRAAELAERQSRENS